MQEARHWRTIAVPASALGLGVHTAVWTGREVVIWGYNDALADVPLVELALDPVASTWRELAPSDITERTGHAVVWTGREMIVVGGSGEEIEHVTASAYDPEADAAMQSAPKDAKPEDRFQFERHGYFVADRVDSKAGVPVFNRTVTLKDSWAAGRSVCS